MDFKQEKGITTATVIVYVIVITFVVTTLSVVTGYFRQEVNQNLQKDKDNREYIKFASYFVQDIQEEGNKVIVAKEMKDENEEKVYYIQFSNGNIYQYGQKSKRIYRNQLEICKNIELCQFVQKEENDKTKIIVDFAIGDFNKTDDNALIFYM